MIGDVAGGVACAAPTAADRVVDVAAGGEAEPASEPAVAAAAPDRLREDADAASCHA